MENQNMTKFPRYERYKDSGVDWIGEIPEHWKLLRLGSFFSERRKIVSDVEFPPLSVTMRGIVPQLDTAAKSQDGDNRKLVCTGDFVINSRSDRKGSSGVSLLDGSVSLINIVLEPHGITPKYTNYLFKNYTFIEEYYRIGRGIVADLWTTRYSEMKNIMCAFPPLSEQTAIAQFLDHKTAQIDRAIAIKEEQIKLLNERKQIMIQEAVTKGLDPTVPMKDSGVEWIGEIPEHWEVSKAKYCSIIFVPERSKPELNLDKDGLPWVTTDQLKQEKLSISDLKYFVSKKEAEKTGSRKIKKGSVLATCVGTFGIASINNFDCIINQQIQAYTYISIENEFLQKLITISKDYFDIHSTMTTIPYVNKGGFANLPIVYPSKLEQKRIIDYLDHEGNRISKAASLYKNEIKILKEYKTTLINEAVTGKIKVN